MHVHLGGLWQVPVQPPDSSQTEYWEMELPVYKCVVEAARCICYEECWCCDAAEYCCDSNAAACLRMAGLEAPLSACHPSSIEKGAFMNAELVNHWYGVPQAFLLNTNGCPTRGLMSQYCGVLQAIIAGRWASIQC